METSRPRKPFMDAFRDDVANGFLIGVALGSAYQFPDGGFQAVRKNVPRLSCCTAVFCGIYTAIDYAMVSARRKEKPVLDCAAAMGGASGIITLPKGVRRAGRYALIGGLGGAMFGSLKCRDLSPQAQKES